MSSKTNSNLKAIRLRLGINQVELGGLLGVTRSMVSQYETGLSPFPPDSARKLIQAAKEKGEVVTYDDVYGEATEQRSVAEHDRRKGDSGKVISGQRPERRNEASRKNATAVDEFKRDGFPTRYDLAIDPEKVKVV